MFCLFRVDEYEENKKMFQSFLKGHLNEKDESTVAGSGIDALDEGDMLHADLIGHKTQVGPPHALLIMTITALSAILVRLLFT